MLLINKKHKYFITKIYSRTPPGTNCQAASIEHVE